MNDAMHHIRKAILDRLSGSVSFGGVTINAYNTVPRGAAFPYIHVYSVSSNEIDQNAGSFNAEVITRVEVIDRFDSNTGGELSVNSIISDCLNLLRTRTAGYFDLTADGFKVYGIENRGITYLTDNLTDHSYKRAIMELVVKVTE
jgi:hypothetical protein